MITHLKEYVNRLKRYSQTLDNFAILTDQPWVTRFGNLEDKCVYIFRNRGNQLLKSINDRVEKGKWDYLPSMKSLLIELDNETTLYNQGFFDHSVMILRRDGTDEHQLFVNENKIKSTVEELLQQVEQKYLSQDGTLKEHRRVDQPERIVKFIADDGELQIFTRKPQGYELGDKILLNGDIPQNGKIKLGYWNYLLVQDGKIKKIK